MTKLQGKHIRLEPLELKHVPDLWKHTGNDSELWKWVLVRYEVPENELDLAQIVKKLIAEATEGTREPWAVIDLRNNECVGSTSYLDLKTERRTMEIGSTFYGETARRTPINTETKYLLLKEAFDVRGYERVQFKADNLNVRSLTAIERIGATKEGVMRNHFMRRDGSRRDTVIYSIIKSEWPGVALRLQQLLNG